METRVFRTDGDAPDDAVISQCAAILKRGGIVAFPTETVYGLGADALNAAAVEKLYAAKNRPPVKPLSLCVADLETAESVAVFNDAAKRLFAAFLPGPLTIVLPKRRCVPDIVTAGLGTVGIRVPSNKTALALLASCGFPIALPSANLSGQGALTSGRAVAEALRGRADAVIDAGETSLGVESTVVSLVGEPAILRRGVVSEREIWRCISKGR